MFDCVRYLCHLKLFLHDRCNQGEKEEKKEKEKAKVAFVEVLPSFSWFQDQL